MGRQVALITAAGYKGVGQPFGHPFTPECMLPLGNGETSLTRQARQLESFERYITVSEPGTTFRQICQWNSEVGHYQFTDIGPRAWTQELIDRIAMWGTPIVVQGTDWKTTQDSICVALDQIGYDFERIIISPGDQIYTNRLMHMMSTGPISLQYSPNEKRRTECVWVLEPDAARMFRKLAHTHRIRGMRPWFGNEMHEFGDFRLPGDSKSTGAMFAEMCPLAYVGEDNFPGDIDTPRKYVEAMYWISERSKEDRRRLGIDSPEREF